ncbi:hypothetical protein F0365_06305 [Nonlabens sp. Ci31]|nr:hypothetical protein F0365_06305 [Nonlabens sp. Ci31]
MVAIAYQFVSSKASWIITIVLTILGALLLKNVEQYRLLIGMFVPTVIHVYLFTLIFMLYGAKKSNSRYGYISMIVALTIPVLIINLKIAPDAYLFNDSWKEAFLENDFHVLPVVLSKYLGITDGTSFFFYEPIWIKFISEVSFDEDQQLQIRRINRVDTFDLSPFRKQDQDNVLRLLKEFMNGGVEILDKAILAS